MGKTHPASHLNLMQLQTNDQIHAPLWFSLRNDPALSMYPTHDHAWGEFIYAYNGVLEVNVGKTPYTTAPPYGIWLPPHIEHNGINHTAVSHGTIYIHESLCAHLPTSTGVIFATPFMTAILQHLKQSTYFNDDAAYSRVLHVFLDQLKISKLSSNYLPHSHHTTLKKILNELQINISDQSTLQTIAKRHNMTERTLARLCQKELGMSLHDWRQRFKVTKAMEMLNSGLKVESIALELGYASSTAFINMFKRWMNMSPDQFRKL